VTQSGGAVDAKDRYTRAGVSSYMASPSELSEDNLDATMSRFIDKCIIDGCIMFDRPAMVYVVHEITEDEHITLSTPLYTTERTLKTVSLYLNGDVLTVKVQDNQGLLPTFACMNINEWNNILELNSVEIFHGKQFSLPSISVVSESWQQRLLSWIHIANEHGDKKKTSIVNIYRVRHNVHTRRIVLSGYTCLVHVYEERKGEF
jgi:hypothetical protein